MVINQIWKEGQPVPAHERVSDPRGGSRCPRGAFKDK